MGAQAAEQIATRFRHADMVDRYEALSSPSPMGTAGRRPARFHPDQWAVQSARRRGFASITSWNGSWLPG